MEPLQYEKRGYLREPFRLFCLADGQAERIEYHYHTFHKIIILLAGRFYISKYHMMRRFRQETGYSVHGYLTEKRLLLARQLLGRGCTPAEAALQAGYQDYSTFSRAYKKQFGCSPSADAGGRAHDLQTNTQDF